MSGTVAAPTVTVPMCGAPSTGVALEQHHPARRSGGIEHEHAVSRLDRGGMAPSTPTTSRESARPTMAGSAGPGDDPGDEPLGQLLRAVRSGSGAAR